MPRTSALLLVQFFTVRVAGFEPRAAAWSGSVPVWYLRFHTEEHELHNKSLLIFSNQLFFVKASILNSAK